MCQLKSAENSTSTLEMLITTLVLLGVLVVDVIIVLLVIYPELLTQETLRDSPPESPPPTEDPDQPEYTRVMSAAIVTTITPSPKSSVIFQSDGVDVYAPDLGLVKFKIQVGNKSAWTEDIKIKNLRQFVPVPWENGAIDVVGTPRSGGAFQITPIFVRKTAAQTFPDP